MALIGFAFIPRCAVSCVLLSLRCASQPRQRQPLLSPWRHGRNNVSHRQGRSSPQMDERNRKAALGWIAPAHWRRDRKTVVEGKSVSARVDRGGRRIIKKKTENHHIRKNTYIDTDSIDDM